LIVLALKSATTCELSDSSSIGAAINQRTYQKVHSTFMSATPMRSRILNVPCAKLKLMSRTPAIPREARNKLALLKNGLFGNCRGSPQHLVVNSISGRNHGINGLRTDQDGSISENPFLTRQIRSFSFFF